jgi:hypothetical protein
MVGRHGGDIPPDWTPFATLMVLDNHGLDEVSEISNVSSRARNLRRSRSTVVGLDFIKEITITRRDKVKGGGGGSGSGGISGGHKGFGGAAARRRAPSGGSVMVTEGQEVDQKQHQQYLEEVRQWERNLLLHENIETVLLARGVFTISARGSGGGFAGLL